MMHRSQAAVIARANWRLEALNQFQSEVAQKISRYLAPRIFSSIFSGLRDVKLQTERKKLTIFFSDIKDFTSTTEQLHGAKVADSGVSEMRQNGSCRRNRAVIYYEE